MQMQRPKKPSSPGLDLYNKVRAAFILQGTTLNAWCLSNGIMRQNAQQALTGSWNGPKGRELREKMLKAANMQ